MKRSLFALLALFLVFATIETSAQVMVTKNLGTMVNSVVGSSADRTATINLENIRKNNGGCKFFTFTLEACING